MPELRAFVPLSEDDVFFDFIFPKIGSTFNRLTTDRYSVRFSNASWNEHDYLLSRNWHIEITLNIPALKGLVSETNLSMPIQLREAEIQALLPMYYPEEFGEQKRPELSGWHEGPLGHGCVYNLFDRMEKKNDRERLVQLLAEKIPQFPPEVHELRLRILEDTLKILNALYGATEAYCEQRKYL